MAFLISNCIIKNIKKNNETIMNFEKVPTQETEENLDSYVEEIRKKLINTTLERIQLAPDNRKAEALEDALKFYGALDRLHYTLDSPNIDAEIIQESMSKLAEMAGLDPEIVSLDKYSGLVKEVDSV